MSIHSICTIIHAVRMLIRLSLSPAKNNVPSERFQQSRHNTQKYENANENPLPMIIRLKDVETLENIDDAEDDDSVAYGMVVDVPIHSVFVVLLWPQKQSKYLQICYI